MEKEPHRAGYGGKRKRRWWIYPITFKRLPLSLNDFQNKSYFDRKFVML